MHRYQIYINCLIGCIERLSSTRNSDRVGNRGVSRPVPIIRAQLSSNYSTCGEGLTSPMGIDPMCMMMMLFFFSLGGVTKG